jgi:predicted HNH restriction endonuclease
MPRGPRNTPDELTLCTYAAMYDANDFGGVQAIFELGFRSLGSIKMKIQNIAAMLDEEGIARQSEAKALSGVPPGRRGRRTDWEFVSSLLLLPRDEFLGLCFSTLAKTTLLPDEFATTAKYREGALRQIMVNAYERDPKARKACLDFYGPRCVICDFDFAENYGDHAKGFIHVHHICPLSEIGNEYLVDPVKDLRPVCPNCHAVIHMGGQARSIEEVKSMLVRVTH